MSKLISSPVTASTLTRISLSIITMTIMLGPILGDLLIGEPVQLVNYTYLLVAAPMVFISTWLLGRIIGAYRKNSEYLNELISHSADGVMVIDQKSCIVMANQASHDIFGYDSPQLIGRAVDMLIPNSDRAKHRDIVAGSDLGETRMLNKSREIWGVRADGSEVPLEISISPVAKRDRRHFVGIVRDISDRRLADEMLKKREHTLRMVTRVSPVGILSIDKSLKCTFANHHWQQITESNDSDFTGVGWMKHLHPDDRAGVQLSMISHFQGLDNRKSIEVRVGREGEWNKCMLLTCSSDMDEGDDTLVAAFTDLTDQKLIEQKLASTSNTLATLNRITSSFLVEQNVSDRCNEVLDILLKISDSQFGFLAEYLTADDGRHFMRLYALSDISWDSGSSELYKGFLQTGYIDFYTLDNLFGWVVLNGAPVLSNDPATDERSKGFPSKHPLVNNFRGLPLTAGEYSSTL